MSFRKRVSQFWSNVQLTIFPMLMESIGELSKEHKKLVSVLELVRVEEFLENTKWNVGRPRKDRIPIVRAFVAKIVLKITYTKQLIQHLKTDRVLKCICGWDDFSRIPSESKFSRAFQEFAKFSLPEKAHKALIQEFYGDQMAGHVVKDSFPLEVREKPIKKDTTLNHHTRKSRIKRERLKLGGLNRRQKQLQQSNLDEMIKELPKNCDIGMKRSPQGYTKRWKGYKVHVAVDDHCLPLAAIVTSASLNDCEVAIPLTIKSDSVVKNFYDLMDAAYDHPEIREHSRSLGHVPIIDKCPKNKVEKHQKEKEKSSKRLLGIKLAEDVRYKERLPKERFNALYKDYHGGRSISYRGHPKISCHVMFGFLVVAASIIINLTI